MRMRASGTLMIDVDTLTFAMGPVQLDEDGEVLRQRFAIHLSQALRRPVRAIAAPSYAEVAGLVERGEAQLAWLPPAVFVRLEQRTRVTLLAALDRGRGEGYRGVLFVSSSSSASTPEELRGARAVWVDADSCAGHLFPCASLRARGAAPDELFADQRFLGSHGSVVRAVARGEADAGATYAHVSPDGRLLLAGWYPYVGASGMRAVLVSEAIPADVICASSRVDADAQDELREALLALHEDAEDLLDDVFGAERLVGAHTGAYDVVRVAAGLRT